jgi:hypothetical protein
MIRIGTKFGLGSNGDYVFYIYGDSYTGEWGNNNAPTLAQLQSTGFMEVVPPVYDPATHKPTNDLEDNGVNITNVVIPLSPEELAANQAILTRQEILEFKQASADLVDLLKDSDQDIIDDIALETAGADNQEIVDGIRAAQAKTRIMLRDLAKVVKAMVS